MNGNYELKCWFIFTNETGLLRLNLGPIVEKFSNEMILDRDDRDNILNSMLKVFLALTFVLAP